MLLRLTPLLLLPALLACGDRNSRYLIAEPAPAQEVSLRVSTIEVREVALPAYAADSVLLAEAEDGSLKPIRRAVWADEPIPGITAALARRLDERSSATAVAEPWPLLDSPAVRLHVRVDTLVARQDGTLQFAGQFTVENSGGSGRINRFDITTPLPDQSAATVASATGAALDALAEQVIARLR